MSEKEKQFTREKITQLIISDCIEEVPLSAQGWTSNVFLQPKRDGSYRMILNLKPLNEFIEYKKFKMPTIHSVIHMIKHNDFLLSVDLKDAYSHLSVIEKDHCLLHFAFEGKKYRYKVLPNGIAVGPRFFVEVTKTLAGYLWSIGVETMIYIDDTLIIAKDLHTAQLHAKIVVDIFQKCGFSVNWDKSHLTPSQKVEFLGFMIDSRAMSITLTEKKCKSLRKLVRDVLLKSTKPVTIRHLAKIIGTKLQCFQLLTLALSTIGI